MRQEVVACLSIVACLAAGGMVVAEDSATPALTTKLDLGYVSKYVWRGIPQTKEGAFQPAVTFAHTSGLSFNFWASEDSDAGKVTENDYTFNYAWNAGKTGMNAGVIYYAFPNTSYASTSELYASACLGGALSPTFSVNYDVDEANGFYASLGAGYAYAVPWGKNGTSLNLSGRLSFSSAGYNKFWFGVDDAAVSDLYMSASVPFTVGKGSLTPSLSYSTIIDGALRDALSANGLDADNFVASLTFSYGL